MSPPGREPDGGSEIGFDEQALYVVVRKAVEDAILGAIGTLLLVGVAVWLIWLGALVAFSGGSPAPIAAGVAIVAVGFYLAAATLEIVPSVREWI